MEKQLKKLLKELYTTTDIISSLPIDYIKGDRLSTESDMILYVYRKSLIHMKKRYREIKHKLSDLLGDSIELYEGRFVTIKKHNGVIKIMPQKNVVDLADAE